MHKTRLLYDDLSGAHYLSLMRADISPDVRESLYEQVLEHRSDPVKSSKAALRIMEKTPYHLQIVWRASRDKVALNWYLAELALVKVGEEDGKRSFL